MAHATLLGKWIIAMYGVNRDSMDVPVASERGVRLLNWLDSNEPAVGKRAGLEYFPSDPLPC